jgi:hypothetical protein
MSEKTFEEIRLEIEAAWENGRPEQDVIDGLKHDINDFYSTSCSGICLERRQALSTIMTLNDKESDSNTRFYYLMDRVNGHNPLCPDLTITPTSNNIDRLCKELSRYL